jgi:hypothetical protein
LTVSYGFTVYSYVPLAYIYEGTFNFSAPQTEVSSTSHGSYKHKTVYSWHDGGIVSATTGAKNTADALTNPLVNLNEEIQRLEELLESEKLFSNFELQYQ